MKTKLALLALSLAVCLVGAADSKPNPGPNSAPGLADVIHDPSYLRQALGRKAIVLPTVVPGKPDETLTALHAAGLDKDIEFFALPANATPPKALQRQPPAYPQPQRDQRVSGSARYLFVIGADGLVKAIYCCESSDPDFALSGAKALIWWRYTPAKIQGTAVPVVASQLLEFSAY